MENISGYNNNQTSFLTDEVTPGIPLKSDYETPLYAAVSISVLYLTVFLIGLVGNCLIIHVVVTYVDMRSSTNLYLANLSVADLLVLLICLPSGLAEFHSQEEWFLGDIICRVLVFLENLVASASVLTIVAVSIDRTIRVWHPLHAKRHCTTRQAFKVIAFVWITAILSCSPFFALAHQQIIKYYDESHRAICVSPIDDIWKKAYVAATLFFFFLLPLFLLLLLYVFIGRRLYTDSILVSTRDPHVISLMRSRRQAVIMLMSIVILFFVSLLPIRLLISLKSFGSLENLHITTLEGYLWFTNGCRILFYVNSAGNPILCVLISKRFRRAFSSSLYFLRCMCK